jgi:hypothetical protein
MKIDDKTLNFELKSTTVRSVSTASPLTINHLEKWRDFHWIVGIYDKKTEKLKHCYYGSPADMKDWIDYMMEDIKRGLKISEMIIDRMDKPMMYAIFGKKKQYTYKEARAVYKNLFPKSEYMSLKDLPGGYSSDRMLEMFKKHNWNYLKKGSWLNNPKIGPKVYKKWKRISRNHAKRLVKLVRKVIHGKKRKTRIMASARKRRAR